jgi:myo-inositol-1(or 4)-monophosphatase
MLEFSPPASVSDDQRGVFLDFAVGAAIEAGSTILPYFRSETVVENKLEGRGFDPVTEADKAAELILRERISAEFPAHGICGEEFGLEVGNGLTWVIDPIDGTRAFMSGMLHWGLLLGLFDGERPVVGVMYQPYTEELWCGDGQMAEFRRHGAVRPLRTRACHEISDAVLTTTSPNYFKGEEGDAFRQLESQAKLSKYGGDCYIYGMLAMGFVDLATDGTLNPYDIQGLIPIIEGAGGVVTTYDGGNPSLGGTVLASGNQTLHERALEVLNGR